ncbi:DRTGG domain protein [Natrialba magadii ATCC 43099]|uniref:DRTGG domain protein n=1 Tax=Natrialba magadii (strain ATCC 43099 / DSM 3394 / CCM 3739 / CIP 104546 / IAM 13178 / JCM 8861 / NBRC 102185 / NCIMB 2190 / MS3) TaxID=547559 RepID=D3STF9_NATMM|nr:phosphotransacetylase family protein [Natrialba magadii]ADD07026.1 DRTGG domain protein [Natrialba magadii ATCC 43099]ELY28831.1 DRTGG domain-containing protein [Natrialba magadii ATCC 43099]
MTDTDTDTDTNTDAATNTNTDAATNTDTDTDPVTDTDTTDHSNTTETANTTTETRSTSGPTPETDADTLLVASLEESTGKTAITMALARLAQSRGEQVGYMKPKGTRLQSNVGKTLDEDPMLARELLDLDAEMHDLEPVVYSPTFIEQAIRSREDAGELQNRIVEAYEGLAADCDRMFVEGGGRYDVGGIVDLTDPDIAALLDASVLLVAPYETPGDIDDVLAAADAFGDRLVGVVFNNVTDAAYDQLETDVVPFLETSGVTVFGIVPSERSLSGVTVETLADELGGTLLVEDGADAYVERFAVGAMGADSALRYFRRTKDAAVITGGDRAEIQTAALEAPGVRCLILTGGHRPSGAVIGQAAEKGLPIISIQTDTLTTVERAEDIVRSGRTRDAATVDQMKTLLSDHAALDDLYESMST